MRNENPGASPAGHAEREDIMDFSSKNIPIAVYISVLPLFFMAFCLLYDPFHIVEYCGYGTMAPEFHLLIMASAILLVTAVSRTVMSYVRRRKDLPLGRQAIWCAVEAFCSACSVALYIRLSRTEVTYFQALAMSLQYVFFILVYPYALLLLLQAVYNQAVEQEPDPGLIKFNDEQGRLKLSIAPSSILFVNAEANYVKIHYAESGKVKEYMLRTSMKSIEGMTPGSGLVRCQRSYFVNPEHIKVLRKDKDGFYYAELDMPDIQEVPVSKQYFDTLSSKL